MRVAFVAAMLVWAAVVPSAQQKPATAVSQAPYTYDPGGRRDPFQSLAGTGGDPSVPARPTGEGLAAVRVEDVAVRGVLQTRDAFVAMVQGTDNKTYLIHQGDALADGVVKSVTPEGLVLLQTVADPRATEKTREVRKLLRAFEDGKE